MATREKTKAKQWSVKRLEEMLRTKELRDDHAVQRLSAQWASSVRDNFIARILNDMPIPAVIVAEQEIQSGITIKWLIDGKQRLTTLANYIRGTFRLGKKMERPIVQYVHTVNADENEYEIVDFDIRGKKFKDLPEELQKVFLDYDVPCTLLLDCTEEDIEYHIRSYNSCKPMTAAQKGITFAGSEVANAIKKVTERPFFREQCGKYTDGDFRNGNVNRIISESVMVINFFDQWTQRNEENSAFLKRNATQEMFDEIEDYADRLAEVFPEGGKEPMFSSANSFLFFWLFDRFQQTGLEDERFAEFVVDFRENQMDKEINGESWNIILSDGGSKGKTKVEKKLHLLEALMYDFFGLEIVDGELKSRTAQWEQLVEEVENSAFIKRFSLEKDEIKAILMKYLSEGKPYENEHEFLANCDIPEAVAGDITQQFLPMLDDWVRVIPMDDISADDIPELLKLVAYTIEADNDMEVGRWLKSFLPSRGYFIRNYGQDGTGFVEIYKAYDKERKDRFKALNECNVSDDTDR